MSALNEESIATATLRQSLLEFWRHLSPRRRRQFRWLLALMVASAFAEVISLSAILPFLGILTAPERVLAYPAASRLVASFGIHTASDLVLPLTALFIVIAVVAAAVRTLLLWVSTRLAFASGADLSLEIYRRTLYQPYSVHVSRNSSEVVSGIVNKINDVVFAVLMPLQVMLSAIVLLIIVSAALVFFNPMVAASTMGGFGAMYMVISLLSRRRLKRNSIRIADQQTRLIKALQEGLGGIRDVLLDDAQAIYSEGYRRADARLRRAQASNSFTSLSPRFAMEAVGMVVLALLAYALNDRPGGVSAYLPLLGALALGAQRLLPALQQVHSSWASIMGYQATLAEVLRLLDQEVSRAALQPVAKPLRFDSDICFERVRFRYDTNCPWVLDGIDLTIRRGMRVGFVGSTGSGKSTLLDLFMGLLAPTEGEMRVDGVPVNTDNVRAWQRVIAHVPQSIYLSDASIAENIAFGKQGEEIDLQRVRVAAQHAQIASFIESGLGGYQALVGERGVRLSGGQRQRLGIARALYRQSSVLVLDEATSALDAATESSVMTSIGSIDAHITVLIIAHRLLTVRHCDLIVQLERGRIVAMGTFDELMERSPAFRMLTSAAEIAHLQDGKHVQ